MGQEMERIAIVLPDDLAFLANGRQPLFLHVLDLFDHGRRHGIELAADAYQQGLRHRQGERQIEAESRSLAGLRQDFDTSAQVGNGGFDDVHADTAAGHLRQFGCGRETGLENEFEQG